jgi:glucosamine 6-phosphate synthetase-like amidotransferase/phosphosugar isomerase protein
MCGIFGYLSLNGMNPSLERLRNLARITETRGRQAFGYAWMDRAGQIYTHKQPGRITDNLELLDMMTDDCIAIIGHCRLPTNGTPQDNRNNHPHKAGSGWYVHNGTIRNYRWLINRFSIRTSTGCDSEVLGLLYNKKRGRSAERIKHAIKKTESTGLTMAGLWPRHFALAHVSGRPLHIGWNRRGIYFASLRPHLPENVRRIVTDKLYEYERDGDRWALTYRHEVKAKVIRKPKTPLSFRTWTEYTCRWEGGADGDH